MLRNHEYTFFIECRVCGRPLWSTYKVVQLRTNGFYSFDVDNEDAARDMVSRLEVSYLFNKSKTIDSVQQMRYNIDNETENVSNK